MEIKTIILISFSFGFIAGWGNDKAKQNFYGKITFIEHLIVPSAILFIIYSFFQSINFGLMSILQITLGSYIGGKTNMVVKKIFKR